MTAYRNVCLGMMEGWDAIFINWTEVNTDWLTVLCVLLLIKKRKYRLADGSS